MIEVKNVNKSFDGKQVLFDISANLLEGHANLIIGQSGSGKTVLMKSVAGIHRIDSGEILYEDGEFFLDDTAELIYRKANDFVRSLG